MLSRTYERRVRLNGSFDSLGLATLVGAPMHEAVGKNCSECSLASLPDFRSGPAGPSGAYELTMMVAAGRNRLKVSSFEMSYGNEVATFLDLALPVGLSQSQVLGRRGAHARAILTPFEAVGAEAFAAPPVELLFEVGSLSGAVSVVWPDGDETYLQRYADHSLGFVLQNGHDRLISGMVLPCGYDIDLDLHEPALPDPGVMALVGCTLGAVALFSRREF